MKMKLRRTSRPKLRWGIIGCGKYAETGFIPALMELKRSRLVSVYSHDISRANSIKNRFSADFAFDNLDNFLSSDIDSVYIGSINSDHYEQVIRAAKAGKDILCEKPLSLTSEQAEEMVRVCEENNVLLTINYVLRYHPLVIKAKELIDKGVLGKIITIGSSFNINYPPDDNYRFKKELSGGGALWDLGTHIIDLFRFLNGDIKEIKGFTDNIIYKSEVEDFASAIFNFEKSGYGYFTASYNSRKAFNRIEIVGYNGALGIDNLLGKKAGPVKLIIELMGETKKSFRKRGNIQLLLLKDVEKSFLHDQQPMIKGLDGLQNIRLLEKIENR